MKAILVVLGLLGAACSTTFVGPRAISPKPTHSDSFPAVDSCQPTLSWQAAKEPGVTYDLAVFEVNKKTTWWSAQRSLGERVYYREALPATVHQIEVPLAPGREHAWLVRERRGDTVGPWSRYNFFDFYVVAWRSGSNFVYRFKTPEAPPNPSQ